MDIFDSHDEEIDVQQAESELDADGTPYCKKHFCSMAIKSTSAATGKQYYYCRVEGCDESEHRARPKFKIPSSPQCCPKCSKPSKPVACEVARFTRFNVVYACPEECGFEVSRPRPDIQIQTRKFQLEQRRKQGSSCGNAHL